VVALAAGEGDAGHSPGGALAEYAAGTDPSDPGDDCESCLQIEAVPGEGESPAIRLRFRRIINGFDLRHRFEVSGDMLHWVPAGDTVETTGSRVRLDGIEEVEATLHRGGEGANARYVRLVVERVSG
jgi:hypothetical protein